MLGADPRITDIAGTVPYDVASGPIKQLLRNADPRRKARNKPKLQPAEPAAVSAAKEAAAAAAAEELLAELENEGHAVKLSKSKKKKQRAKEKKARKQQQTREREQSAPPALSDMLIPGCPAVSELLAAVQLGSVEPADGAQRPPMHDTNAADAFWDEGNSLYSDSKYREAIQ